VLSRQEVPTLDREVCESAAGLRRGGYVLRDAAGANPRVILMASGSEVSLILAAAEELASRGIGARVVSMPSWELFDAQPQAYRDSVLPPSVGARVAVEAGVPQGWCKYTGSGGDVVGLDRFGASAPGPVVFEKLGLTADAVIARAVALL
jgi:transketolase